ncbi:MAG: hypothetical protein ACI9JN_002508 [Bacteroidia bacterium]|jgi:hypothetical protein
MFKEQLSDINKKQLARSNNKTTSFKVNPSLIRLHK